MPKQFIGFLGESSTFQTAVQRVTDPGFFQRPLVISSHDVGFILADQLAQIGAEADIILEPTRRDSAAAIAVAACHAARRGSDTVVLAIAADQVIDGPAAFVASCEMALEPARQGYIMTLGVIPRYPEISFGYIQPGDPINDTGAFRVDRFVEKPDAALAQSLIGQGFLWNSGAFLFRADVMIGELARFEPAILSAARKALAAAEVDGPVIRLDAEALGAAPKTSIDYAVMERTGRAGVLPVSYCWSDLGSWGALWEASPHDAAGNAVRGDVEVVEARNSLVHSDGILTAVVGLDDVVVVAKPDAVLVTSRRGSERVKDLVASLRAKGRPEAGEHVRTIRSWGRLQRIAQGPGFRVTRIVVEPGRRLSLRTHRHRAAHWVVVEGIAEVTIDDAVSLVHESAAVHVPPGALHRLGNPGRTPLEVIEVQVGGDTADDEGIGIPTMDGL